MKLLPFIIAVVIVVAVVVVILLASRRPTAPGAAAPNAGTAAFVFVKIPEPLSPVERGSKYEDPLNAVLKRHNVGEVTGGGSQLAEAAADGTRKVEWIGVDVDLYDLDRGLPLLKTELSRLGAPEGTVLEFERDGKRVSERIGE